MNYLEQFKYSKDDPTEFGVDLNTNNKEKKKFDDSHLSNLLSRSIRVEKEIFPTVGSAIEKVFKKLNLNNEFNFFVTADNFQANAACSLMPSASKPDIIITSKLIELLSEEELQFIIGHEVAHYYYQHSLYPHYENVTERHQKLNILNLSRSAEISADRVGLIASGSLEKSLRANLKLASGLGEKHLKFSFSKYLDQLREIESVGESQSELWSTHPSFLIRIQALIWFSMSKEYHEFFDTKKKGVYDLKIIDNKIDTTIKKIVGKQIESSNQEIYDKAKLWGSLKVFLIDKTFSKEEQNNFRQLVGQEKAAKAISWLKLKNQNMLDKKVEDSFSEASTLLKTARTSLAKDLTKAAKAAGGKKIKILETLSRLLNLIGEKKPTNID
jgi:hypothetical protein